MSTKMSQKEYLKKYLSGGSDKKKKKKDKKSKKSSTTVKIIDDDAHGVNGPEIDEELLLTGEDAPQIVGIIDATGANGVENKWKSISGSIKEEVTETRKTDDDLWGKRATSYTADNDPIERKRKMDQSPPRKPKGYRERGRSEDQSPPRQHQYSDQSPPRRNSYGRMKNISNQLPSQRRDVPKTRRDSDSSPQRRRSPMRQRKNSDQSPPRRTRWETNHERQRQNSDQSPSKRKDAPKSRGDSDSSPPKRPSPVLQRKDSDQSPPRRTRWDSNQRKCPDSDLSPPRKRSPGRQNPKEDFKDSYTRIKREKSADQSPPRKRNNSNPFRSNVKSERGTPDSPKRHGHRRSSDQSPPVIKRERYSESPPPTHKNSGKMSKTLDGKRAGLQDAKTLKVETEERRRAEDRMFNNMSSEVSGRDAEVQVRQSSSYRRRRREKDEDPEVQRKKAEHEEQKKELYSRWNKGLKQIEAYQARVTDEQYESSKPLARYSDDADLDEMLKQQEREDDPMLEYMRSRKKTEQREANVAIMPKYKGSFPENRFGIAPGYRWDGVDRSNGYEVKWFNVQSQKKALAEEAYKYSTEDM